MTNKDELIERLETYLDQYEGLTPLPDAVRNAVRAELPRNRQAGRARPLPRILTMTLQLPPMARYGLVAAAALVVVIIGAGLFIRGGSVGGPSVSPSPSSAPTSSATAASSPARGSLDLLDSPRAGDIPAGDYYIDIARYPGRIDFTVPEGWFYYWSSNSRAASDVHAVLVNNGVGEGHDSGWGLAFAVVRDVLVDPCNRSAGYMDQSVLASADALSAAFTWADFPASSVEDVTVGGFPGKRVEITDETTTDCDATVFVTPSGYAFGSIFSTSDPKVNQFTFVDIGGSVLVLWTTDYPGSSSYEESVGAPADPQVHVEDQVALHEILDSIVITPR